MSVLYLTKSGLRVSKHNGRIIIKYAEETVESLLESYVKHIVVIGNVQLTNQVILTVLNNGGSISWMGYNGTLKGVLGSSPLYGETVMAQAAAALNKEVKIKIARHILTAKLKAQAKFLYDCNRTLRNEHLKKTIVLIKSLMKKIDAQEQENSLMGIEGIAARTYFSCFGYMAGNGFVWNGRNRRPPRDEINSMLSFAYYLVERIVRIVIMEEGLHPGIGYLHSVSRYQDSFVFDIMEPLRTSVAERFVFNCIHRNIIKKDDFTADAEKCTLTDAGRKNFTAEFENFISSGHFNGVNLHSCIKDEIRAVKDLFQYAGRSTDGVKTDTCSY